MGQLKSAASKLFWMGHGPSAPLQLSHGPKVYNHYPMSLLNGEEHCNAIVNTTLPLPKVGNTHSTATTFTPLPLLATPLLSV